MSDVASRLRPLVDAARKVWERGILDLGASMVVVMGLGFAQNLVLARLLGAEGLGHMAIVNSTIGVATLLATAGLTTSILRYGAVERDEGAAWGLFRSGTRLAFAASLLVAVGTAIFSRSSAWVFDPVAGHWLPLVALSLPSLVLASCASSFLQARSRMRARAIVDVVTRVLQVGVVVAGAAWGGLRGVMLGLVVGSTLGGLVSLRWTRTLRAERPARANVSARELLRFGAWGLFNNAFGLVLSMADVFAVSALLGDPALVGVYSLAVLLQQAVTIPMRAYLDARFPEMTQAASDLAVLAAMRRRMQWHVFGIAAVSAVAVGVVAPTLLPIVFGKDFAASAVPLWILLAGQLAWSLGATQGRALLAAGWVEGNTWANMLAAIANVVAQLVLVPRFGIAGAAMATALTNGLLFSVSTAMMYRWWERRGARAAQRTALRP